MGTFHWILRDEAGADIRATEAFETKDDAEAWMGTEWSGLADEGAVRVVLMENEAVVYDMSLAPG